MEANHQDIHQVNPYQKLISPTSSTEPLSEQNTAMVNKTLSIDPAIQHFHLQQAAQQAQALSYATAASTDYNNSLRGNHTACI